MQQELGRAGDQRHRPRQQHDHRRDVQQPPLPALETGQHRGQVVQALGQRQALVAEDAFHAPDLHRTLTPAHALADEGLDRLRRHAEGQRLRVVDRLPALGVQPDRGVQVLGHGAGGEAADLVQRRAAHDGAAAAEEGCIPGVLAALDDAEEQRLLGPHRTLAVGVAVLVGVEVEEVLRRLHEGHARVVEVAQRAREEVAPRRVVAVEEGDQLALAVLQRVVEVAGLGVQVVGAGQVAAAEFAGQRRHLGPAAVVEQPHRVPLLHRQRGEQRLAHQRDRLVVGRHEDVHRALRIRRRRLALAQSPAHEDVQQRAGEAEDLGAVDQPRQHGGLGVEGAQPPAQVPDAEGDEHRHQQAARRFQGAGGDGGGHGVSAFVAVTLWRGFGSLAGNLRLHGARRCRA